MAHAEGRGRELIEDRDLGARVIPLVGREGACAEQDRQPLLVGDHLELDRDSPACALVDHVARRPRLSDSDQVGDPVVLTHPEGVHGREQPVLVGPHVASQEEARVVGGGIVGQAILVAREEVSPHAALDPKPARAVVGAQRLLASRVRAVDRGAVEPSGDLVHLLARVGSFEVARAGEGDRATAERHGVEVRVPGGDGDREGLGG